ncbi:MAG: hypothetical protein NWE87_06095 [Candidatus Bathyarchaeota archaeon]|nr:hypothetical protein [Candidatus Bathyarchaeota archaeon]
MPVIPNDFSDLVRYAFRAIGNQRIKFQRLWLFLSFGLRQIQPSEAIHLIKQLVIKGDLIFQEDVLTLSPRMREIEVSPPSSKMDNETSSIQELGKLLSQFVGQSRLSSAVGIDDSAVVFKSIKDNPVRIEASIQGTRVYQLLLDEGTKVIQHDCPDWLRKRKLRRFCKHVAKIFLLLEKDEAVRILTLMLEESWRFEVF